VKKAGCGQLVTADCRRQTADEAAVGRGKQEIPHGSVRDVESGLERFGYNRFSSLARATASYRLWALSLL
jgi:hypothetical protein